jgi:type III restriction enzyme
MLNLKEYQQKTLEILRFFLEAAHLGNHTAAFAQHRTESAQRASSRDYRPLDALAQVPYVCLRLPTGGGKTLLGAYSIATAAQAFLERDFPWCCGLCPPT